MIKWNKLAEIFEKNSFFWKSKLLLIFFAILKQLNNLNIFYNKQSANHANELILIS